MDELKDYPERPLIGSVDEIKLQSFKAELDLLLKKYNFSLIALPYLTQDGRIEAFPQVVDMGKINQQQSKDK